MFMVNRLGKWFFGDASKESIIDVPDGQLYIVRPLSLKGYSELIYKDARATIRRTGTEFQYQLVITRVFEEGEEELLEEEAGDDVDVDALVNDEQSFLLDEALQFRVDIRDTGEKVFAWRDLSGATGDLWEFVCDTSTRAETVESFELVAVRCQYERKYKKSAEDATEEDLHQFIFTQEPIPSASPILSPSASTSPVTSPSHTSTRPIVEATKDETPMPSKLAGKGVSTSGSATSPASEPSVQKLESRETYSREIAELHLYDFESGVFVTQDQAVEAVVMDLGNWNYWLKVSNKSRTWISRSIEDDLNPVFNFEYLSTIFNVYGSDSSAYSWLLRFKDQAELENFQQGLMQALWEHNNQVKWAKLKDNDQDYILEAFKDLEMTDADENVEEEEESDEEEDRPAHQSEQYDSDESQDDTEIQPKDGNTNSQLAVGQRHDRAFVVRGSKIGVFKNTDDNQLQFMTNISKVQTPKGKLFSPKKVMLHAGDTSMIVQHADNPNSVYRMDLEAGKIVDEWKVHDDIPINTFAPESKFAQMTDQQTFLGLSKTAMYRVDPRLSGNKLVDTDMKQYASKMGFTTAATTEKGYIAVGSDKGEIRLFDRLGVIAKTSLPSLDSAITGLDVSADGRYVLATTKNYLLLIDTLQKDGKYSGKLGFERSFAKDSKPQPRRLALTPSHVAQFQHETKVPISFTAAKFNTGPNTEETTIVTSTGPFVVTWSLKKILKGQKDPYSIKRYVDDVKADNFRFNTDKGIIVALPNEVDMIMKRSLKRPTRESIAPPRLSADRRSSARRNYLGRDDIVKSAY